jgi:GT2 family glycosyltransferase/SAM-dependent methyltransferase
MMSHFNEQKIDNGQERKEKEKSNTLQWTGERYVPQVSGNIELEHLHRYAMARDLATGKIVLDIACGEGYGSDMIAQVARRVIGVDISHDAIEHAKRKYFRNNLDFRIGSCAEIPLGDSSVDLVVSFETIEHHDQHESMISEIKRVLRPDGVIIISSPEKYEFSVAPNYNNPFHIKELYRHEFEKLMVVNFKHVAMFGQRVVYGSGIFRENSPETIVTYDACNNSEHPTQGMRRPIYLIAVASDSELSPNVSSFFEQPVSESEVTLNWLSVVVEKDEQIGSLNQRIAELDRQIANLSQAVAERDAAVSLVSSIKRSTSWRFTAPLRFLGHLLRGDLPTAGRVVRYVGVIIGASLPRSLSFFLKQMLSRLLSITGYRAYSTANPRSIDAIIAERWKFTRETPALDPLMANMTKIDPPNIDISVVTYNSSRWVKDFIESLISIDYPKSCIIIRFVDNGSSDSTVETLQAAVKRLRETGYTIEILQRPNLGFGAGHNVAIRTGDAPFCLVTNIDLTFERNTLSHLVATAMADVDNAAAWEARQKPYEHPKFYDPVTGVTNWNSHACVLLRRSALELVGYYDETLFMYGEDVELSYRLRREGYVLRYCPNAVVNHYSYEHFETVKPLQYTGSTFANLYIRLKYGNRIDVLSIPLMCLRLAVAMEVFPGSRRLVIRNIIKLALVAPKALLSRRRSKVHFPFRDWDFEMIRDGASLQVPPLCDTTPLVSVITRTYNGREVFLRQALLSVAHQSYPEIEHVVVQDGGDTMRAVIEGIAGITRRNIRFISLDKVGRSAAGNAAIKASTGRWCLFLDDDDLLFYDHIEVLMNALYDEPDAAGAYSLAYEVVTDMLRSSSEGYRELTHSVPDLMRQEFDHTILAKYNFIPIQSMLFDRNLFIERGGLPEDMDALEDWVLWNRYSHRNRFIYVPKLTSMYRVPFDPVLRQRRQDAINEAYPLAHARNSAYEQAFYQSIAQSKEVR